jgi:hypothetical protein
MVVILIGFEPMDVKAATSRTCAFSAETHAAPRTRSTLASPTRFELVTSRLGIARSIRLSYGDIIGADNRSVAVGEDDVPQLIEEATEDEAEEAHCRALITSQMTCDAR